MTDLSIARDGIYFPGLPDANWHQHRCAWCPNLIDCAEAEENCDLTDVCLDCQIVIAWTEYANN